MNILEELHDFFDALLNSHSGNLDVGIGLKNLYQFTCSFGVDSLKFGFDVELLETVYTLQDSCISNHSGQFTSLPYYQDFLQDNGTIMAGVLSLLERAVPVNIRFNDRIVFGKNDIQSMLLVVKSFVETLGCILTINKHLSAFPEATHRFKPDLLRTMKKIDTKCFAFVGYPEKPLEARIIAADQKQDKDFQRVSSFIFELVSNGLTLGL